ncbi:Metallo-dependent phosphatase-like protein [Amanita rubescens]|nr:Metallo-dependent phosphatase-like protein [Amanita rubescens]
MSVSRDSVPPPPTISDAVQEHTIRILLATDNHIGYMERDPIRGQDSINTFKEILQLTAKHEVDFLLLAGDLFHENKPSRESLYQTIALLREYTLGDRPVQVELLSDPEEGKPKNYSFPAINYEDSNFNVATPVFSIHGNHDDPQGTGAEGALCALDVLSASGLINYMGKIDLPMSDAEAQQTGIAVRPVLLQKGRTRLGLYGIGNVKDQRMHFELRSNRVRMYMPRDKDKWFNILLLHQNRVAHGPQNSVPEGMFDDSVDLVVWGHEHDCRIIPEPVAGKPYFITQPGSSVATSLAEGEAMEKHVALLEIQGKEFQLTPIPLRTTRPFVIGDVVLSDAAETDGLNLSDTVEITQYLKAKVNELIQQANELWDERNERATQRGEEKLPRMLPLVRLKVDTTGVSQTSNPVRFGQDFQGRIANPREVLVFHRSRKTAGKSAKVSEKLAKVRVGTLVKEYLSAQELQLLGEHGMSDAIQMFVDKDDTHAIETHVTKALNYLMKDVRGKTIEGDVDEDSLHDMLLQAKEQHEKDYVERAKAKSTKDKGKARNKDDEAAGQSDDSMLMDVSAGGGGGSDFDALESDEPPPKKTTARGKKTATKAAAKAPAKKAPAKGRGKKPVQSESEESIEIEDEEEVLKPKNGKKTNRAAVLSQPPAAKKATKKATAGSSKQAQLNFAPVARGSTRAAATRARGKMVVEDDSE